MIRIAISSICFVFAIFFGFYALHHIENVSVPLVDQITLAVSYSSQENLEKSQEIVVFSKEAWDKSAEFLGMLLRLNEIESIDDLFIRVSEHAKNGDNSAFESESAELIHRLKQLVENEKLSLKNIF